jgi:hypothetical protein
MWSLSLLADDEPWLMKCLDDGSNEGLSDISMNPGLADCEGFLDKFVNGFKFLDIPKSLPKIVTPPPRFSTLIFYFHEEVNLLLELMDQP